MSKYLCQECHYLYDDAMEEVRFEDLPDSWECPVCGAPKSKYALKETDGTSTRTESEKMENLTLPAKSAVPVKAADELEVCRYKTAGGNPRDCRNRKIAG